MSRVRTRLKAFLEISQYIDVDLEVWGARLDHSEYSRRAVRRPWPKMGMPQNRIIIQKSERFCGFASPTSSPECAYLRSKRTIQFGHSSLWVFLAAKPSSASPTIPVILLGQTVRGLRVACPHLLAIHAHMRSRTLPRCQQVRRCVFGQARMGPLTRPWGLWRGTHKGTIREPETRHAWDRRGP